jgi:hypothetical protein
MLGRRRSDQALILTVLSYSPCSSLPTNGHKNVLRKERRKEKYPGRKLQQTGYRENRQKIGILYAGERGNPSF